VPGANTTRDGYLQLLAFGMPSLDGTQWISGLDPAWSATPLVYTQVNSVLQGFPYQQAGSDAIMYASNDVMSTARDAKAFLNGLGYDVVEKGGASVRDKAKANLDKINAGADIPPNSVLATSKGFWSDFWNGTNGSNGASADIVRVIVIVIAIIMIGVALYSLAAPGVISGLDSAVRIKTLTGKLKGE
jgi:hypothetical protein